MNTQESVKEDTSTTPPTLQLSQHEQRVLEAYDQLRELEVRIALLKAQKSWRPDASRPDTDENLSAAREDASKAKASWLLRNSITDSVMMANPILKAVHNSTRVSPVESDLLPHIRERDAASSTLATRSKELRDTLDALTTAESDTLRTSRRNAELARELLELAEEADRRKTGDAGDNPELQRQMEALQAEVKTSRQKWKVMKGTASAVVVGSGVDWVRDDELRWIVLDPEDDEP